MLLVYVPGTEANVCFPALSPKDDLKVEDGLRVDVSFPEHSSKDGLRVAWLLDQSVETGHQEVSRHPL